MRELPPSLFTFSNYNADIPFKVYMDNKLLLGWLQSHNIIGYCKEPSFKAQKGQVAVLFDLEEQGEYWSHISDKMWDKYIENL